MTPPVSGMLRMVREVFDTCRLHQASLLEGDAAVRYGLVRFPADYVAAKERLFPNSYSFVLGGCRVSPTNPKTRKVQYCPQCREAERAWQQARRKR